MPAVDLNQARAFLGQAQDRMADTIGSIEKPRSAFEEWIKAHPAPALGVFLGIGVLLGWLIKRR